MPRIALRILCAVLGILFPFIAYWAVSSRSGIVMAAVLAVLGLSNLAFAGKKGTAGTGVLVGVADLVLAAVFLISGNFLAVKLYPLAVTGCFLSVFAMSLAPGRTPIIEKIASYTVKESDRDDFFRKYCRGVTVAWCLFFVVNGLVSLATAIWGSDETWTVYNGIISYFLIGMMFTVEYVIRIILRKRRKSGTDDTEKL